MLGAPTSLLGLACRVRLGLADWRDVEAVGLRELASGKSGPTIVALADVSASTEGLSELVGAAISAEGGKVPDSAAAAEIVALEVAEGIASGEIEPVVGARVLWRLARDEPAVEPQLRVFIGLVSEWDDDVTNRLAYEADIVAAAGELPTSAARMG